jgi:ABC-type spermidine/putrescine transport system, permease component II
MSTLLVRATPRRLVHVRHLVLGLFVAMVALYLVLPTIFIIPMSVNASSSLGTMTEGWTLGWYRQLFEDPVWGRTALVSLKVGVLSTLLATVAGTLLSLALVRVSPRYRMALRGMSLAPMVVPPVILGIGLYILFLHLDLYGTMFGFVLGHAVLALPFVVVSVSASLAEFDPGQEKAALILGATPTQAFLRVVLPQIIPGIVSGALFGFVTSWDEVIVSTFLASPGLKTLPVEMWTQSRTTLTPVLAALSTLLMLFSTGVLVLVNKLQSRPKGRQ